VAVHLRREQRLTAGGAVLSVAAAAVMLAALLGNIFPVPPAPYLYFPYIYAAYLGAALVWYWIARGRAAQG